MRFLAIATVALLMTGCDFPYQVVPADVVTVDDTAMEDTGEVADTSIADSGGEIATDAGSCDETGGSTSKCTSCAIAKCPDYVSACNSDPICNKWLECARACVCPTGCLKNCSADLASDMVKKTIDCLAMNCSAECF